MFPNTQDPKIAAQLGRTFDAAREVYKDTEKIQVVYFDKIFNRFAYCEEKAFDRMVHNGFIDPCECYAIITY